MNIEWSSRSSAYFLILKKEVMYSTSETTSEIVLHKALWFFLIALLSNTRFWVIVNISTSTFFSVVQQKFVPQVYDDYVIRGNTAVLRCHLPSFVREYVTLDSWLRDDETVLKSTDTGGKILSVVKQKLIKISLKLMI